MDFSRCPKKILLPDTIAKVLTVLLPFSMPNTLVKTNIYFKTIKMTKPLHRKVVALISTKLTVC